MTSTLGLPTVLSRACNWRLLLLTRHRPGRTAISPYAATGDGFRRPRADNTADADDRHMGRLQAVQAFNAIQMGDACNRGSSVLMTITPKPARIIGPHRVRFKLQVKNLGEHSRTNVRLFAVRYTLSETPV